MISVLNLNLYTPPPEPKMPVASETAEAPVEFEIVMGRRQVASTALVVIVLVAVFSGVSYLIGKSMAPDAEIPATAAVVQIPAAPVPVAPASIEQALATNDQHRTTAAPLFGVAVTGKVYLQVGVIEKGLAAIWAEGLRSHGMEASVAPGPTDGLGLWRVLIGPLPDAQAYQRAKDTLDALGLTNFGRRYPPQ